MLFMLACILIGVAVVYSESLMVGLALFLGLMLVTGTGWLG